MSGPAQPMLEEERPLASETNVLFMEPRHWPEDLKSQLDTLLAVLASSARLCTLEATAKVCRSKGR